VEVFTKEVVVVLDIMVVVQVQLIHLILVLAAVALPIRLSWLVHLARMDPVPSPPQQVLRIYLLALPQAAWSVDHPWEQRVEMDT
jgi:hypothetical protein